MPSDVSLTPRPLPRWVVVLGSFFAVGHLTAVALLALAPPSGPWSIRVENPWPQPGDPPPFVSVFEGDGPRFASLITEQFTYPYYLQPLRMTHNYHFQTNRVSTPTIHFDVQLKNADGMVVKTLQFPDERANFWVRHRQGILAQGLGEDQPVQKRPIEFITAPNQEEEKVECWLLDMPTPSDSPGLRVQRLQAVEERKLQEGAARPSDTAKVLGQSYIRHLCREHGAKSAELVRRHRNAITPMDLFRPGLATAKNIPEIQSHFGASREK